MLQELKSPGTPQLTCAVGLCTTPESSVSARSHATLGSTRLVVAVITGEDQLLCVEKTATLSLGIGRGTRVSTVHWEYVLRGGE